MGKPRTRYNELGRPEPCRVEIPAELAVYLYQAVRDEMHKDETALVVSIVRAWALERAKPDWSKLLKELQTEDEAEMDARKKNARKKAE